MLPPSDLSDDEGLAGGLSPLAALGLLLGVAANWASNDWPEGAAPAWERLASWAGSWLLVVWADAEAMGRGTALT